MGKTARQFNNLLSSQISSKFRQLKVDATIESIASIRVHIVGEVAKPGSYVLNGMATVFTALYTAGGPTKAGTFRRITVSRDGEPDRVIDLYNLLINGSKKQDIPLEDGDLVFVPPVGKTITVGGEVVRPGRYEPNFPITLSQAIKLAGGAKPGGYLQAVQVERVENNEYKTLLSAPMGGDGNKAGFKIQAGDEVTVTSVRPDRTNQVSINGLVVSPGMYGFKSGMHVIDLIKLAQGLSQDKEVYTGRADILRIDPLKGTELVTFNLEKALKGDAEQNVVLHKLDRIFIYSPEQVVFRPMLITIKGAIVTPGTYKRSRGMRVSDAIAAAGGILPEAYLQRADLIRHKDSDAIELVKVDLQKALNGDPTSNVDLTDRDELTIYTADQAGWRDRTIRIEGAVQRPGAYQRAEGMRVSDLIFAAGGLLPEGAQSVEVAHSGDAGASTITKVDLAKLPMGTDADPILKDGDIVTVPSLNPFIRTPEIVYLTGEVVKPGPYVLANQNEKLTDVIARAGGLTGSADQNGMMFLRRKESFQNTQQEKDADVVLKKSRIFADKEFLLALSKMGVSLPPNILASGVASQEDLTKPVEVVPMKTNGSDANAISEGTSADKTGSVNLQVDEASYKTSMKQQAKSVADKTGMVKSEEENASNQINPFGPPISTSESIGQSGYISDDPLSILADSARISVSLSKALKEPNTPDNLALRNGDRIFIPKQTDVVTVMGAVLHPHSFAAGPGKNADYYIERSGGFSQEASKGHVIVVRANGDALPKNSVRSVEPGDIIVVPSTGLLDISKKWERVGSATKVISDILSSVFVLTKI